MKKFIKILGIFFAIVVVLVFSFWIYLCKNYATPILMYHSLDKDRVGTYAAVDPAVFYRQMQFIRDKNYQVMPLGEYCQRLRDKKPIPWNTIVLTFDDGYKDNLEGIRILKDLDLPATIFVIVNKIGKTGYLSKADINKFIDETKITIGSHGIDSAYLPETDNEKMRIEIEDSKRELEHMFFQEVKAFAYPIGGFDERALGDIKDSGYLCACATNRGFSRKLDRFALRRIKVTNRDLGIRLWAKLSGFYNVFRKPKNPY